MKSYEIKKGDTLEKIAKYHNMKTEELIEINKIKDWPKLGIGNMLKVKEVDKSAKSGHKTKN